MFSHRCGLAVAALVLGGAQASAAAPPAYRWDLYGDPLPPGAVVRMGTVRWQAAAGVLNLTTVPGGKYLASSDDARLFLWDLRTGRRVRTIPGADDADEFQFGSGFTFTPDARRILSAGSFPRTPLWMKARRPRLFLWDFAAGKQLAASAPLEGYSDYLAVSPDGRLAAVGTADGEVLLWDTSATGLRPVMQARAIKDLAFALDGGELVAVCEGRWSLSLRRWDLKTGRLLQPIDLGKPGQGVALSPGGERVAVFAGRGQVILHDVATGKRRRLAAGDSTRLQLCFSGDSRTLLGRQDDRVIRWDTRTGRSLGGARLADFPNTSGNPEPILLSEDGRTVIGRAGYSAIHLWDARTGRPLFEPVSSIWTTELSLSADGRRLVTHFFGSVSHWETATGKRLQRTPLRIPDTRLSEASDWLLTPTGRYVVEGGLGKNVAVYDTTTGDRRTLRGTRLTSTTTLTPDGRGILLLGGDRDYSFRDLRSGREVRRIGLGKRVREVSWASLSPDGRQLAVGEGWGTVHLFAADTRSHLRTLRAPARYKPEQPPPGPWEAAFSPDGRYLAVSEMSSLWVWDLTPSRTGDSIVRLDDGRGATPRGAVSFSIDGRFLAWFDDGLSLCLAEMASGRIVHLFDGWTPCCAFTSAGWRLVAPSFEDSSTLVWDLGLLFRSLPLPPGVCDTPESLWEALAVNDAGTAQRAVWRLAVRPDTDGLLARHLSPVTAQPAERLTALVLDLGHPTLPRRTRAENALTEAKEAARPALERALQREKDIELQLRVRRILAHLAPRSATQLRDARAVLVLEARGTPEARRLLEKLAAGLPDARLTREAKAALGRLTSSARRPPR